MAGASSNTSQSTSNSSSFIPAYEQSPFLMAIAQYAGQAGDQIYNWAQQQFAKNTALTDNTIGQYLSTSAKALGQAQNDYSRYTNKFQPEEDQLLKDANSYASNNRVKLEMGAAEAGQAQAADANMKNAERDLQSFGIDPSSGRYAALDKAAAVRAAANEASAAQLARQHTEATGRQLRSEAIQVGERYPGQITNSLNTAMQGFSGATNAGLANSAAGVALQGAADPYLNTASSLKYPPLGTSSQSQSTSSGSSTSSDGGGGNKDGSQPQQQQSGSGGSGGAIGGGTSPYGGYGGDAGVSNNGSDTSNGDGSGSSDWGSGNTFSDSGTTPYGQNDPYSGVNNYESPYGGSGDSGFDSGAMDYGGGGGGEYFAAGGAIPDTEDGGMVPQSASPSGGQAIDDVGAQLPSGKQINVNADEFIVPRDVALWKGQEFFQKLIDQSRQALAGASAKPTPGPTHV